MQEYKPDLKELKEINTEYPCDSDFFTADNEKRLNELMDLEARKKARQGYSVSIRKKIGRNELCPCESGKKFKKCCINKAIR